MGDEDTTELHQVIDIAERVFRWTAYGDSDEPTAPGHADGELADLSAGHVVHGTCGDAGGGISLRVEE